MIFLASSSDLLKLEAFNDKYADTLYRSTLLVLVKSSWPTPTIEKISTLSSSLVREATGSDNRIKAKG
jgi:hypothetical protein